MDLEPGQPAIWPTLLSASSAARVRAASDHAGRRRPQERHDHRPRISPLSPRVNRTESGQLAQVVCPHLAGVGSLDRMAMVPLDPRARGMCGGSTGVVGR